MHDPRRSLLAALLALLFMAPLATAQTPAAASFDCDALSSYRDDVYEATRPDATLTEQAIAQAAQGGGPAYQQMGFIDLHIARLYYERWADAMADVPPSSIPGGLEEYHDLNVRHLQGYADGIQAYLDDDPAAYDDMIDEAWARVERWYEIGIEGVDQCGDAWIDAMGEPRKPERDATPVATPN